MFRYLTILESGLKEHHGHYNWKSWLLFWIYPFKWYFHYWIT